MLAPVPTRPRSNPFRRRRGAAAPLPAQIVAAAAPKRPAESSTSASSSFRSEVISTTSSTALAAAQRPDKRPRLQDADEARPAASECSEVIGGARARAAEVEVSESSCLGSVLESDLACPEQLADDAEATEYSSARDDLTQSDAEEEVLSAPSPCSEYSLTPLIDSSSSSDDDDDAAPSPTFSLFLAFAEHSSPARTPKRTPSPTFRSQRGSGLRTWTTKRPTSGSGAVSGGEWWRVTTPKCTSACQAAMAVPSWSSVLSW